MKKTKVILAFALIGLSAAILAVMLLGRYVFHWLADDTPVSICFWSVLCLAYSMNNVKATKPILVCRVIALLLLAFGVASLLIPAPERLSQIMQILCFVNLGAILLLGIFAYRKTRTEQEAGGAGEDHPAEAEEG